MAVRPVIIPGPRALKIGVAGSRPASLPTRGMSGAVNSASAVTGTLRVVRSLAGTINGSSTVIGALAVITDDTWPSGTPWPTGELWPT
jgi:D-alanyl-D-alanine carboxypeptidase